MLSHASPDKTMASAEMQGTERLRVTGKRLLYPVLPDSKQLTAEKYSDEKKSVLDTISSHSHGGHLSNNLFIRRVWATAPTGARGGVHLKARESFLQGS